MPKTENLLANLILDHFAGNVVRAALRAAAEVRNLLVLYESCGCAAGTAHSALPGVLHRVADLLHLFVLAVVPHLAAHLARTLVFSDFSRPRGASFAKEFHSHGYPNKSP